MSGTALAALVAWGLFSFNDRALAQNAAQLPTGGTVVGGSATITQNGTSQLTVNQTTDRGVIDWRSFSIGQGNRVDFIQPGRGSVTLNRVTGADPSVIAGSLNANGQIVLVNQAGVFFGGGAQVNVESLIASTANVANPAAFMAGGKIAFDQAGANPNARIVNDGTITVRDGGLVALLGPSAANNGVINARLGRVTVGGAETFTVDLNGDGLVNFAVGRPVSQQPRDADGKALALASNTGTINADGGMVAITASAAREVVNGVVNVQGQINARTVQNEGGVIVFGGGETTQVNVGGTIDVSGAGAAQKGGTVHITASKVNVQSTARVNANGGAGGGTVLVGGGKQGAGPIANAKNTAVAKGAVITADATHKGNGGQVIIWADNTTVFAGTASANGGPQGGNGGFVETSGRVTLSLLDGAMISVGAPAGAGGLWLMDPTNLTLDNAAVTTIEGTLAGGGSVLTQTVAGGAEDGNITLAANLSTTVLANQDVTWTIRAHGKIDLGSKSISITPTVGKNANLVLDTVTLASAAVDRSISGTGAITTTTLTATSGGSVSLTGKVALFVLNFNANGAVTVNNTDNDISYIGTSTSSATGAVTIISTEVTTIGFDGAAGINAGAGTINISTTGAGDNIVLSGAVKAASVTLASAGSLTGAGSITATGAISLRAQSAGGINLSGAIAGTGLTVQSGSGGVTLSSSANVFNSFSATGALGGALDVTHKGSLTIGNTVDTGANPITVAITDSGNLTISGALQSTGGITLGAAGQIAVNAEVQAGVGSVALAGAAGITQGGSSTITAGTLSAKASAGSIDLTGSTNKLTTFAASATGTVGLLENDGFTIGSVSGINGITGTTVRLKAGGTISQTQAISATSLGVATTAGNIDLTTNTNSVGIFAASSAGFVGLLESDGFVVGQAGTVGALTTLSGVSAGGVASFKAGGAISQTQAISATGGLAAITTSGGIDLDDATNATQSVAFNASGAVSYKTSTSLVVSKLGAVGSLANITGISASSTSLSTTGASTSITQSQAISTGTLGLSSTGTVTLDHAANVITQVTGNLGSGTHTIVDSTLGLTIGAISTSGALSITTTGGALTVGGTINAGGQTVTLIATDNAITATAAAINAGTLSLQTGVSSGATMTTAAHSIGTIRSTGSGIGSGGLTFSQNSGVGISVGPLTSTGAVSITELSGSISLAGAVNTGNADLTLTSANGGIFLNAAIGAGTGTGTVTLSAAQGISQFDTNAGITAATLSAFANNGNISLAPLGTAAVDRNTVSTFAAGASNGSVAFTNTTSFTIDTIGSVVGIATADGFSVSLETINSGAAISQAAGTAGRIVTGTLNLVTADGSLTLASAGNDVLNLGTVSLGGGALTFVNSPGASFDLGTVTANGGISVTNTNGNLTTSNTISSAGNIVLTSSTGKVLLSAPVTSSGGDVTVQARFALTTGGVPVTANLGNVTLISDTGDVTASFGGVSAGKTLTLQAGAGATARVSGPVSGADIVLLADHIAIATTITATNSITVAPVTSGTQVTLGSAGSPGGLIIGSAELSQLSAPSVVIGKLPSGLITAKDVQIGFASVDTSTLTIHATGDVRQDGGVLTVGSGGIGALNVHAGSVDLSSSGVSVGSIGGSATTGDFSVLLSTGGVLPTVNAITTASGDIAVQYFSGDLTVAGALSSNGGNILLWSGNGSLALNAAIDAGLGTVSLLSQVAINQSAPITSGGLVAVANGTIALGTGNAVAGNVTLLASAGNVLFANTSDFTIVGASSASAANVSVGISDNAGLTTGGSGTATLIVGGNVTQGVAATDEIRAGTLIVGRIGAANPNVTLGNPDNSLTSLDTVSLGAGSFSLTHAGNLAIVGSATAGNYAVSTIGGSLVVNSGVAIDTSKITSGNVSDGTITLTASAGGFDVELFGTLNAGSAGTVSIGATRGISQKAGAIIAGTLEANAGTGSVVIDSSTNAFGIITGSSAGEFVAASTQTLTVGTSGVQSAFSAVNLTAIGASSDIVVGAGSVGVAGVNVTLEAGRDIRIEGRVAATDTASLLATGGVADTSTGKITAPRLRVVATNGAVALTAGSANHDVDTIAGSAGTDFAYTDGLSTTLTIGIVTSQGVIANAGDVTIKANAGTLVVGSKVAATAAGGDVTLHGQTGVTINAAVSASTATGVVSLVSAAGSVIENGGGAISGAALEARAAANVSVAQAANAVSGFAALATTGFVAFGNTTAIELRQVGTTSGVTAAGSVVIATNAGAITQTATGIITAGSGLQLQALDGAITLTQSNAITGSIAITSTTKGDITLRNAGAITIGTVGSGAGITSGPGQVVSLISESGTITQSGGANDRIIAGEFRTQTAGKAVTLNNAGNQIGSIGTTSLGSGALSIFDSNAGLTVSGSVAAAGGVSLTTQDTLAVNAGITSAGTIALKSAAGAITLGASVSTTGQVQLDAGGAISQSAGTITANALIARASGAVTLTQSGNDVTTIAGSSGDAFTWLDKTAIAVGSLTDASSTAVNEIVTTSQDVTIVAGAGGTTGGIAVDRAINAGGGVVRLQTAKGDITQGASGVITGLGLLANADAGDVGLATVGNAVGTVAGRASGSFRLLASSGLNVSFIVTDAGSLTTTRTGISTGTGDIALQAGGALSLLQPLNAAGTIRLRTTSGGVSQAAAGSIIAPSLLIDSVGDVSLVTSTANSVGTIAGRSTTGGFTYTDASGLIVGSVTADGVLGIGPLNGITAAGMVRLTADRAGGTAGLSITQAISADGQTVRLDAAGGISQTAAGTLLATNLQAISTAGSVDLTAAGATNKASVLAGSANGDFAYTDGLSTALSVGTIAKIGVVSNTGDVAITANGGTLSINQAVTATASGGDVTLQSKGDLVIASAVSANSTNGLVGLTSSIGSVVESSGGTIAGAQLVALAATNIDIAQSGNAVGANGFASKAAGGFVSFANGGAIRVDQIGAVSGVFAAGTVTLTNTSGSITQTANGIITAGAGLLLQSLAGSIVLDQANAVTGNFAVMSTLNGDITLSNAGVLNIGTVGAGSGITGASGRFLSLISGSGAITQSAGPANSLVTGDLRLQTASKDATLANTANQIDSIGMVALGAGKFTGFDSTGGLTVNGSVTANGGVVLTTSAGDIVLNGLLTATGGQIQLDAAGALTQTSGAITATSLIARATGAVTMTQADNDVATLAGSSIGSTFTYVDKTAVSVGSLTDSAAGTVNGVATANKDIVIVAGSGGVSGGIALDRAVNAGNAIVRLQTSKGDIAQGAAGVVTAGSLLLNATAGAVELTSVASAVGIVAGKSGSSFRLLTSGVLQVGSVTADAGALTTARNGITAVNADIAIQTVGALTLNQALSAGSGTIRLRTTAGGISQAAAGAITGQALLIDSVGAVALATATTNEVATLAGRSIGGSFIYADASGLVLGTVSADAVLSIGPLSGVRASGGVILTTDLGGGAAGLSITQAIDASGQTLRLIVAGDITQTASGGIKATNLEVVSSAGSIDLTAAANNNVSVIAGSAKGNFAYADGLSSALSVGTVTTVGVTSTTGDVTIKANAGTLDVAQAVSATATGGDVTLQGQGSVTLGAAVTANSTVSLSSVTGAVVENSSGAITAALLEARAATNVDLAQAANVVGGFAASATSGFVAFANGEAVQLQLVGATSGVSAGGTVVIATSSGDITQTATGLVTAGGGLLLQASNGSIVLDQTNAVSGNIAVTNTLNGDITLHNGDAINIGVVGPVATAGALTSGAGITSGTARFVSLRADSGTITQGSGVNDRVVAGELRLQTAGKDVTLANGANQFESVGTANLGAGKLTLFDSTDGLIVNGPLTANGGVVLTTSGALSLPGSITVSSGDIRLTSTGADIALAGSLSASGQIQLDAGGGAITQSAGTVTANSLMARAQGSVSLTQSGNDVVIVAGSSVTGTFSYVDNTAVAIGALTDAGASAVNGIATTNKDITIVAGSGGASGGIALDQAVNVGGAVVRLQTAKGDVTQGASGVITAGSLLVNATSGSVDLATVGNTVSAVAGSAGGSFRLLTSGALQVTTVAADTLTTTASGITSQNADIAIRSAGALTLNQALTAGSGAIRLRTTAGGISQASAGAITGQALLVDSAGAVALATSAANDVATLAGRSVGAFAFADANGLIVGSVTADGTLSIGPLSGIAASGTVAITADIAGGTGGLSITQAIDAAGQTLNLVAAGDVTQGVAGALSAASLQVTSSAGAVDLTASAANKVGVIAGSAQGGFAYTDGLSTALTVGTVTTVGIVSKTGDVAVTANGGSLTIDKAVSGTNVTAQGQGTLTLNASMTANAATGIVSLVSVDGSVIENSSGVVTGAALQAQAATNVDVAQGANAVSRFAATATTGFVAFTNSGAIQIDQVGTTSGVSAGSTVVLSATAGDITQTQLITAGAGLLVQAANGSILLGSANLITGNIAVVNTPNGDILLGNTAAFNVGAVGPVSSVGALTSGAGITAGMTYTVSLVSVSGAITQGGGANDRIIAGALQAQTAGQDVTLDNGANRFESIGAVNLGAGRLTVIDSAGDLVVNGPLTADGGVRLTTEGVLSLPGSISVANGDILLTSKTAGIALNGTLSAVVGQVELQAGTTIDQAAGSITAKSLIARAGGNVNLSQANEVDTVAGTSTGGTFSYVDKTAVAIGALTDQATVAVSGITTTDRDITVVAGSGGVSGGIAIDQALNAGTAIVRLQTAQGDVTQSATGVITAGSILVNAFTGAVNLAMAANDVDAVAGKSAGSFRLLTAGGVRVGSVAADGAALTTAGAGITTTDADIAIQSAGALILDASLNAGIGTIRVRTTAGGIGQSAKGAIVAQALLIDAAGDVALTAAANDVGVLAGGSAGGRFAYADATDLIVGSVTVDGAGLGPTLSIGPLNGISTTNADITVAAGGSLTLDKAVNGGTGGTIRLQAGKGDLGQSATGGITGGTLLAVSSGGMVDLQAAKNVIQRSGGAAGFIAGSAFSSFLFTNSTSLTVATAAVTGDAAIAGATGVTANSGLGATARVVDLAVSAGDLTVIGPVNSASGMIVYRHTRDGVAGTISVGGDIGTPSNSLGTAALMVVDLTGIDTALLYGITPGTKLGGLFTMPTPPQGFSPLNQLGNVSGGRINIGAMSAVDSTVYLFGSAATLETTAGGSAFGVLGVYGNGLDVKLSTSVRNIDPRTVRLVTDPYSGALVGGSTAAFFVRHSGVPNPKELFNGCPIGTVNCTVFQTPISAPAFDNDSVIIGVAGAPLDDSGVVLTNQGNEDMILESDDERRAKRKQ